MVEMQDKGHIIKESWLSCWLVELLVGWLVGWLVGCWLRCRTKGTLIRTVMTGRGYKRTVMKGRGYKRTVMKGRIKRAGFRLECDMTGGLYVSMNRFKFGV